MHVLCAPDKFAGAATAAEVAAAMASGVEAAGHSATCLPIADGGEGSFDVLRAGFDRVVTVSCRGPLGGTLPGRIGLIDGWAFIEAADACGIRHGRERRPLDADSQGVGQLLHAALDQAEQVAVGLGGSVTVDGGAGLAHALGARFLDRNGEALLPTPRHLARVHRVALPELPKGRVTAWCDVQAPLLGSKTSGSGISGRSFLAQKGVEDASVVVSAWKALVAALARSELPVDPDLPGTGAAGGLGLMLHALLGARLLPGAAAVLDRLAFSAALAQADLVLTGEGRFDAQSLAGKGPGEVLSRARLAGVPALVLAGAVVGERPDAVAISDPSLPLASQLEDTLPRVEKAAQAAVRAAWSGRRDPPA